MLKCLSGGPRGGFARTTLLAPVFKYPMKMKYLGLSEDNLFHFLWIFKKIEIKSAKRTPNLYGYEPPYQKTWIRPIYCPSWGAIFNPSHDEYFMYYTAPLFYPVKLQDSICKHTFLIRKGKQCGS